MHVARSCMRSLTFLLATTLLVAACGGTKTLDFSPSASPAARSSPTPKATLDPSAPCEECWPLSGLPAGNGAATNRKPLVIKIDNAPGARPHYGITQADMVFEIIVEGGVTRLAAVFQAQDPATIGSVRSARLVDRTLTPMVRGALVYSGTSAYAWSLISKDAEQGKYVELSADHAQGYYRVTFRAAPYNLFTSAANQRDNLKKLGAETANDIPRWGFLVSQDHPPTLAGMSGAAPATDITIPYRADTSAVSYQYDAATKTYARFQNSAGRAVRDVDAVTSKPVAATDVVIIQTEIWEVQDIVDAAGAFSNDMRMTGNGLAIVFRDGLRQDGTWSRKDDMSPFVFKNAAGEQILLSPGQPWIHVVPNEMKVTSQ
ncbi:MAG TPA: DUF3048 domain-containing protein [Candidatus Limnocylindria bacterium]|nr:DUF3048 domain-containing protein [Candidatus Limnocylindria bacterium]